jgi:hypothetical protein
VEGLVWRDVRPETPAQSLFLPVRFLVRVLVFLCLHEWRWKTFFTAILEDEFAIIKSDGTRAKEMTYTNLPCGCMTQWDEDETKVVFCNQHTIDYVRWEGTDREFIKMIATPRSGKAESRSLAEMQ